MGTTLALAAIPPLIMVGLLAATLIPVNLQVTVTDRALVIEPRGFDVLFTMRRRIDIPVEQIESALVLNRDKAIRVKAAGVHLPGVITAGSYGTGEERSFWDVRRADPVLVISCTAAAPYRSLVLEFADPDAVMARINTVMAL